MLFVALMSLSQKAICEPPNGGVSMARGVSPWNVNE